MLVEAQACWLPKAGNAEDEYEDAFWPDCTGRRTHIFRCAVADGATETSFSGLWARLLVEAYGRGHLGGRRWQEGVCAARCAWRAGVGEKPLPWYAEEKLRLGAYAALTGLTLTTRRDGSYRWSALAVGDCCLFQVRDGRLLTCFPMTEASSFSSRPYLLGSVIPPGREEPRHPLRRSGAALPGDRFLLMTDALGHWFLSSAEAGGAPWEEIEEDPGAFESWVEWRREAGEMRNDDVTLLTVRLLD